MVRTDIERDIQGVNNMTLNILIESVDIIIKRLRIVEEKIIQIEGR